MKKWRKRSRRRVTRPNLPSPHEIVRRHFPTADDHLVEHIIWGLTGYPHWWHIPQDGNTPYQCFRKSVRRIAARLRDGQSIDRQTWEAWDRPMIEVRIKELNELSQKVDVDGRDMNLLWASEGLPLDSTKEQKVAWLKEERARYEKELQGCPT